MNCQGYSQYWILAGLESTLPDGSMSTFSYKGIDYPMMAEAYASDLGHLNADGSVVVAYKMLEFLSELEK